MFLNFLIFKYLFCLEIIIYLKHFLFLSSFQPSIHIAIQSVVLPLGLKSHSAPPVFCQLPGQIPWAQSDAWLQASTSALVSCWQELSRNCHTRFQSASTSWPRQQCWVWCPQTSWTPRWSSPKMALSSVYLPFFFFFFLSLFFLWTRTFLGYNGEMARWQYAFVTSRNLLWWSH